MPRPVTHHRESLGKVKVIELSLISEKLNRDAERISERTKPLGREVLVSLKVGEEILKVLVSKPFNYRMGDKVGLRLNTHKIHLFDRKTERSLLV